MQPFQQRVVTERDELAEKLTSLNSFIGGEGKVVMLGLQNEREWLVFCEKVMRQAELADDERFNTNPKRSERREELKSLIVKAFSTQTAAQVAARLEEAGIANAQVNTMADVWAHEQLKARGRWSQVQTTVGEMPALVPPARRRAGPCSARSPPPYTHP